MKLYCASNKVGSCHIDFCTDHHTLETWFETAIAVYSRDNGERYTYGFYKKYEFKTLRAAKNKFDALTAKYGIA